MLARFLGKKKKVDPDVIAFITAAGITNPTQIAAINQLVVDLKCNNLWDKIFAIYPFVGGTASAHSYNLKDTSTYQITWSASGVTHDANGITGNGVSGFGNTNYTLSAGNQDNFGLSIYIRNNSTSNCAIGAKQIDNSRFTQIFPQLGGNINIRINGASATVVASADSRGLIAANRSGATIESIYKNGVVATTTANTSTNVPTLPIAILGRLINTVSADNFSNYNIACSSIHESLNASEQLDFYNAIQTFQTILSRQV